MLCFMIQKRSEVICIFWHFKQFTVAVKRILKNCLKWARVVLKESNGRNQPEYSIVLLISYCQMERAALDNEEQWVFPSLSCLPATCLLSRALLLICYFNVPLTKTAREGEEEEEEEEIKEKKMLSLLMQSSSTHCYFADQPSFPECTVTHWYPIVTLLLAYRLWLKENHGTFDLSIIWEILGGEWLRTGPNSPTFFFFFFFFFTVK